MTEYTVLQIAKGATAHECQDCGAIVFHRAIHDLWHVRIAKRDAS